MAKQSSWSLAARNAKLNAVAPNFDGGYLRFYAGEQPPSADTPVSAPSHLAELRFAPRAFRAATNGMLVANPLAPDDNARASGTPRWYRCFKSDGVTALHDGSVGTGGAQDANCVLAADMIIRHAIVECSAFILTEAAAVAN